MSLFRKVRQQPDSAPDMQLVEHAADMIQLATERYASMVDMLDIEKDSLSPRDLLRLRIEYIAYTIAGMALAAQEVLPASIWHASVNQFYSRLAENGTPVEEVQELSALVMQRSKEYSDVMNSEENALMAFSAAVLRHFEPAEQTVSNAVAITEMFTGNIIADKKLLTQLYAKFG